VVSRFATFNEPSIFTLFGLGFGGKLAASSVDALHRSIHRINLAHGLAVNELRGRIPQSSIGVIHSWQRCLPSTENDTEAAERCDAYWNKAFPDPQYLGKYPECMQVDIDRYV